MEKHILKKKKKRRRGGGWMKYEMQLRENLSARKEGLFFRLVITFHGNSEKLKKNNNSP